MNLSRAAMLEWLAKYRSWSTSRALPDGWAWIGREASNGGIFIITEDDWVAERLSKQERGNERARNTVLLT